MVKKYNEISVFGSASHKGTRTRIDSIDDRKPVLAHVPVRERHDIVHPVPRELLPVRPSVRVRVRKQKQRAKIKGKAKSVLLDSGPRYGPMRHEGAQTGGTESQRQR